MACEKEEEKKHIKRHRKEERWEIHRGKGRRGTVGQLEVYKGFMRVHDRWYWAVQSESGGSSTLGNSLQLLLYGKRRCCLQLKSLCARWPVSCVSSFHPSSTLQTCGLGCDVVFLTTLVLLINHRMATLCYLLLISVSIPRHFLTSYLLASHALVMMKSNGQLQETQDRLYLYWQLSKNPCI